MRCGIFFLLLVFGEAAAAVVAVPPNPLNDAMIVIRANDLLWCDRQIAAYATAANLDPEGPRHLLAGALLRSRSLAGVDISRPALIAWRDQAAPLLAIIPLSDRRAFIEDFGADSRFGAPLVRVSEREGTTVYQQNSPDGLLEYRLLIHNDTAYVASTLADCRRLTGIVLTRIGDGAPLEVHLQGKALTWLQESTAVELPDLTKQDRLLPDVVSLLQRYGRTAFPRLAEQVARLDVTLRGDGESTLVIEGRLLARSDAPLAQFLAVQKNQSSRLLPLLRNEHTAVAVYGSILWQGQLDRLGQDLAAGVATQLGSAWTAQAEDSWRRGWALRDRNNIFATVVQVQPQAGKTAGIDVTAITLTEQAQAGDLVVHAQRFAQAERAAVRGMDLIEDISVAGLPGWRQAIKAGGVVQDALQLATGRHSLGIVSSTGRAKAVAENVVPQVLLDGGQRPEGTAALFAGWIDGGVIARAFADDPLVSATEPAVVEFSAKASPQGDLLLRLQVPFLSLAVLQRETLVVIARPEQRR